MFAVVADLFEFDGEFVSGGVDVEGLGRPVVPVMPTPVVMVELGAVHWESSTVTSTTRNRLDMMCRYYIIVSCALTFN